MQQLTAAAPCAGQPGGHKPIHKQGEFIVYIYTGAAAAMIDSCLLALGTIVFCCVQGLATVTACGTMQ